MISARDRKRFAKFLRFPNEDWAKNGTLQHGPHNWDIVSLLIHPPGESDQGTLFPGYNPFIGVSLKNVYFDVAEAQRGLRFFEVVLHIVEGDKANLPFILEAWQARILANLIGWKRVSDGRRRYRQLFLYVPRKNGKTPFVAGVVLYCLFCDQEQGAQIVSAASDIDQASVIFNHASCMVHSSPSLSARCRVYRSFRSIELKETTTRNLYKAISSNASGTHGRNIHVGVIEELHLHESAELTEGIETGHGSRKQPITIYVTTADFVRPSVCNSRLSLAKHVRDDLKHSKRETLLPIIYETPRRIEGKDVDWKDPSVRKAVNPNLGVSVEPAFLDDELAKGIEDPDFVNTYCRLYLNMLTEASTRWLNMEHWDSAPMGTPSHIKRPPSPHCVRPDPKVPRISDPVTWRRIHVPPVSLLHPRCRAELQAWAKSSPSWLVNPDRIWFAGLDLSSNNDITALVLFSPQKNPWTGAYPVIPFFWLPAEVAAKRERSSGLPYPTWAMEQFLWTTPGEFIDLDPVCTQIACLSEIYNIQGIAFDKWGDRDAYNRLTQFGLRCERYGQGYVGMSEPSKTLVRLLGRKLLEHGRNPVLQWMAGNVVRTEDRDGRIRPDKSKSSEKIDGIIALVMAIGYSLTEAISVYSRRGVISLDEARLPSSIVSTDPFDPEALDPFDPETWGNLSLPVGDGATPPGYNAFAIGDESPIDEPVYMR